MPAEKPVAIYERAIESSSAPGELVVDPFGGSGTLAEAAISLGRRFLVGDVDKRMVRMARNRVGLPVFDDNAPEVALPQCPVFEVLPPRHALWGVHPEDVSDWQER